MDPLSVTASIIGVLQLSAKVLEYLNNVKDTSKDRTQFALEISNLYNLLFNLRAQVEEGDLTKPWYTAIRALAVENGPLDQFRQALETLQDKMTDGGRLKKVGEALVWKFRKEEIVSTLGRIERLKTLVEIALQMDHFKLSQAIKNDITSLQRHVNNEEHHTLLEWISATDYPAQQSDIIKRRQEGTGQWFLNANEVARWLSEAKATLFCPGIPGAGKTMVAAIAVDHLLDTVQSSSVGVAYVYCNYKAKEEQDATGMLAAILKQLVQTRPSVLEPVESLHKQHANRGTRPSLDEVFGALREVLTRYYSVYIVIDALDECQDDSRRQLLAKLRDLQAGQDIRLMATSRFIPDSMDAFEKALRLEVQASEEDVKRFVAGQTYRLPRCIQRDAALQLMVQEMIVQAVDGMFLLARLHTDSLLDKRTVKDVKSTLARLSKGSAALEIAYRDALHRIETQLDGDHELAKKVLSWITFAKRPLTTTEICFALAIEPDKTELDLENIPDVDDLVAVCAGLVIVDQESGVIRLVHYTTQDYFERNRKLWNPTALVDIASACLNYLSFSAFREGTCSSDDELEERLRQNAFLDYAAKHWGEYAALVEQEIISVPEYKYSGYSQDYPKGGTGLHVTARFGLPNISRVLLRKLGRDINVLVNEQNSKHQAPLYLAAVHGHEKVVRLLVDLGADINAQGGEYGNALQAALVGGNKEVVRLLLNKGADVNAQGGFYGNALQAASERGHEQVVRLLVDNGANVNAQNGRYGNALYAASEGGHEQVVRLLINKGANVNAQSGFYGDALCAASEGGYEQIVRLLINKGANVNAQNGRYGNALCAASEGGHEQVVRLLVDKGANVNAQGGKYSNALQAASTGGYEQIVRLLVNNGADVNAQGGYYGDALCAASEGGHEQIVRLLVDKDANVNAQNGRYGNALQAAFAGGYEQIVTLLVNKGADVNAQGGFYDNALYVASERGYEQIVKLLLNKNADINAQGGKYSNALQAASTGGYERIVRLLVDKGADINAHGGHYGNALQAASVGGYEQIVMLLVNKGAYVNAQGGSYGNALYAASHGGYEQVVRLLLDKGADVNARGGLYGDALHAASHGGHKQVVRLLVRNGAVAFNKGTETL